MVHGIIRRASSFNTQRLDHIYKYDHPTFKLHFGDLTDGTSLSHLVARLAPDEIYNLGAMSHVRVSFDQPVNTVDINALGTLRLLEAARMLNKKKPVRFYQASSSEMFGMSPPPQDEKTPFHPRSPYACSKVFSYHQCVNYREAYDMFVCNGILFNHESPRRGETFVTRKITRAATKIKLGMQDELRLGNLDAKRDWGFAGDYVRAMWFMMQHGTPDDFVVATGKTYSVHDFLEGVFNYLDLDWRKYVKIDSRYFRPSEVNELRGDASKAHQDLGWNLEVNFKDLVKMMTDSDMELAKKEQNES
jgi:GDPmannose 4,6-dehydratase